MNFVDFLKRRRPWVIFATSIASAISDCPLCCMAISRRQHQFSRVEKVLSVVGYLFALFDGTDGVGIGHP